MVSTLQSVKMLKPVDYKSHMHIAIPRATFMKTIQSYTLRKTTSNLR